MEKMRIVAPAAFLDDEDQPFDKDQPFAQTQKLQEICTSRNGKFVFEYDENVHCYECYANLPEIFSRRLYRVTHQALWIVKNCIHSYVGCELCVLRKISNVRNAGGDDFASNIILFDLKVANRGVAWLRKNDMDLHV
jgi:hypothetical protein